MQIILLEQIQGLGKLGELVNVKRGFARNFLLPRGKALPASKQNMQAFEAERDAREKAEQELKAAAEKKATRFEGVSVSLSRPASETGQLYGSIKPRDIETALAEQSLEVEKQLIQIGSPIKAVGEHTVQIFLHPEVEVVLPVNVTRQTS